MNRIQLRNIKSIALFVMLFWSGTSVFGQHKMVDKIVAKVGDEYILYSDIQNQKLNLLQNGMEVTDETDCEILEGLLYEKLLAHQAVIDSVEVGDEIVNQEMESRLNVIAQQIGSLEKLEEFYGKSVAQIKAEFFEVIKKRMQAERMKETITQGVDVTPREVKEFFNRLPQDSIPYINSKITVAQIVLYPQVTEKDKAKAMKAIKESRERVVNGDISFKMEAFNTSCDPGSKVQGGSLGWQTKGTMVPEFEAKAFSLEEGEISEIFETQYGYHYLQLIDRKGDNYHVRHVLVCVETDNNALVRQKKRLDSIYTAIKSGTITFEEAAEKFSMDEQSKGSGGKIMNPYTGDFKWDLQNINDIDPQMSPIVDRLNVGSYSPPTLYDNMYEQKKGVRIVKLLGKTKPHIASLNEDYQLIQMAALNEKKQKVIDAWIKRKINGNYVWLDESYAKRCTFKYNWVKVGGS
ncbi:MAG: peptidylprolyl isomerase [Crocinitomicaceae bacterium]|nr:peptidylprolyl isomerase [Crocinitomicaceae bacterium]